MIGGAIYLSGLIFYSALFLFTANQNQFFQIAKLMVAALHCLILIVPAYMAQSSRSIVKVLGYLGLIVYFLYIYFLVGFFPYFGFIPELYTFGSGNVSDVSEVMGHYFKQIFGYREVLLVITAALLFYLVPRHRLPVQGVLALVLLPLAVFSTSVYQFGLPGISQSLGNETLVRRFGLAGFSYNSINEWVNIKGGYLGPKAAYPGRISKLISPDPVSSQATSSMPKDVDRIILVQIESFDSEAIEASLSGKPVMPFVDELRSKCVNYTNFLAMKGAGGSSDAEFSVATGLVPSLRLPALRNTDFSRVETLYDQLRSAGVVSRFAHNNNAGYYGRNIAYEKINSVETDFQKPHETIQERLFAKKALAASLKDSQKSFHYFFNYQSHGPYQGYSAQTAEKFSIGASSDILSDYLATMNEVDQMISELFSMQSAGFEDGKNLFILTADHPSYVHPRDGEIAQSRIPAMICHASFEGTTVSNVYGTIDLYPTILEAFGVTSGNAVLGQNMLDSGDNAVLLPQGKLVYKDKQGKVISRPCSENCGPYLGYTDQYIMLHP